jgi:parallel beta-helix repeat protein
MQQRFRYLALWFTFFATLAPLAQAETFTVTSREDSGHGTLREAVAAANTTTGMQTITFAVPGNNSITAYSAIHITDPITIDGSKIQVVGGKFLATDYVFSLDTGSSGSIIKNISILGNYPTTAYERGILVASDGNSIIGCAVGTDWFNGSNRGLRYGIYIQGKNTVIGGSVPTERNIVSGNADGIYAYFTSNLKIIGNYIGTTIDGSQALSNLATNGIHFISTTQAIIGGNRNIGEGNLISGNQEGIWFQGTSQGNSICGNIIGLDSGQTVSTLNYDGIYFIGALNNFIGLPQVGYGNIIAGNSAGIHLDGASNYNIIQNNLVGLNSNGTKIANVNGITLFGNTCKCLIGGGSNYVRMERNVISGNDKGIYLASGIGNTISGNFIGTDLTGMGAIGNTVGIDIVGNSNVIGGSNSDTSNLKGNIISGQNTSGILLEDGQGNSIQGNYIGLDVLGEAAIPNQTGISVSGTNTGTCIGGFSPDVMNVISGNMDSGIECSNSLGHMIYGNYIGLNQTGTSMIANQNNGIKLSNSSYCWIGGTNPNMRNIICGNGNGITIVGSAAVGNTIVGNWLGVFSNGHPSNTPFTSGVSISQGASGNFIGLKNLEGNLIANLVTGISVSDALSGNNGFFCNTICAFSNQAITLQGGSNNTKSAPLIYFADPAGVSGMSDAHDQIQLFQADRGAGSRGGSLGFLGQTTANNEGKWSMSYSNLVNGLYLNAIATDNANNSSVFSLNVILAGPTMTPTPILVNTATVTPTPTATVTVPTSFFKIYHSQINPNRGERARITWSQPENGPVIIKIYNLLGDKVATLADGAYFAAGEYHEIAWDGKTPKGGAAGSGIYIVQLNAPGNDNRGKIAIVK